MPIANVVLRIRSSCSGSSSTSTTLPTSVTGVGASGVAENLVKELLISHSDPQTLTRAILTASSSYSNTTNVQVS